MRVSLIMPPMAACQLPSLGLAQLKARLKSELGSAVEVELHYLNHDLAQAMGVELYQAAAYSTPIYHTGFGEWLFRQAAFPEVADNREEYFRRYYRVASREREIVRQITDEHRGRLETWIDEMIARYALDRSGLVGFTSMFAQTVASAAIAGKIKQHNPAVVTVLGGPACEGPMGPSLARNLSGFDYVFSGAALVGFPQLVRAILDGDAARARRIGGVCPGGRPAPRLAVVDSCEAAPAELDIDAPIELEYDDFLASLEAKVGPSVKPILTFETSRGCWWGEIRHCTFCGLNGATMTHREMRAERALNQIHSLFRRYPQVSHFVAVDNILPLAYFKTVLPRLEPPPGVTLFYEIKSNLDEEQVKLLARSGVRMIQPGIEALNTGSLKLMQKGVTAFQNLRLLKYCRQYAVKAEWYIIVGFPGEPQAVYEKYERDIPHFTHLPPPFGCSPLRFDRFTPYFMRPGEYGLDLHPLAFYGMSLPFDEQSLREIAYHFAHGDTAFNVALMRTARTIGNAVKYWRARWDGSDGLTPAALHFADELTVADTRTGHLVEHRLSERERRLLAALDTPRRAGDLGADSADALASLSEKGLVFQEDDRYLSLVLPHATPLPQFDRSGPWTAS